MKKSLLSLLVAAMALSAWAKSPSTDPVLMTIDKKPVTVSEFNYLYQKNNSQQLEPQTIDQYLDMFVVYKLKVADAEAEGMQNDPKFQSEYLGYQRDLAQPYLVDADSREKLVQEFYNRLGEEVQVSHIMMERSFGADKGEATKHTLDSLRSAILAGTADFDEVALKYSIDPSVRNNRGHLGWMSAGRFPYSFESMAYNTPVGEISQVFDTPFGYHILKVEDRRPAKGEVLVQHILKLTVDMPQADQIKQKERIDSIAELLKAGADFTKLATAESEDPGSARDGGRLPWFGSGRMVPEFEAVSFALADGEISEPFATSYGWHIVKKLESRGLEPLEKLRPAIENFIDRDERHNMPMEIKKQELRKKFHTTISDPIYREIAAAIKTAGNADSTIMAALKADNRTIVAIDRPGVGVTVSQIAETLPAHIGKITADEAAATIAQALEEAAGNAAIDAERQSLVTDNADYRNLLNEYRDGMLLFEVSDKKVWTKAKNDPEGLRQYFDQHRSDYTNWTAPKFKGFVVFATSDSIAQSAQEFLKQNPLDRQDVASVLQSRYGIKDIKTERVIAAKGENAIIDYLAFGGDEAKPSGKWVTCFSYQGEIIDQPQEPDDVRGAVTTDYQNYLEGQWVSQLRKQHKVKVNDKVLKQIKAQQSAPAAE